MSTVTPEFHGDLVDDETKNTLKYLVYIAIGLIVVAVAALLIIKYIPDRYSNYSCSFGTFTGDLIHSETGGTDTNQVVAATHLIAIRVNGQAEPSYIAAVVNGAKNNFYVQMVELNDKYAVVKKFSSNDKFRTRAAANELINTPENLEYFYRNNSTQKDLATYGITFQRGPKFMEYINKAKNKLKNDESGN